MGDHDEESVDSEISCRCPSNEWISKPRQSKKSTVPPDILEFDYSFCYNSKKLFNLCLIDENHLVFGSGNLIHFFNIETKEITFRRSALGSGIGCITKNPNPKYNLMTVAENGIHPPIILYSFPSLEIVHVLNNGAKRSFTHLDYSRDGEMLVSQAGDPDYMLTIWDWKNNAIILRAKSFQNDVLNVMFSPYNSKQLTTCGLGHIKFWKMNETFTGLKLQGEIGRFGKTEICDIFAIYPLPDEKVISGCEWGNMLVWDGGLIKAEVCRKNRKPCHTAPITQISMEEGEVMTVGMDGYVRIWFWETVDLADPPEDDRFVEIEPIYEFRIGSKNHLCELRHLIKMIPDDPRNYKYYAQDGVGGIWKCDINPDKQPGPPEQLFACHEGAIVAVAASPISNHVLTLGEGGRLHIYNYKERELLYQKQFPAGGKDLIWIPPSIEPSGAVVALAFDDGVIRSALMELTDIKPPPLIRVHLIEAFKSHSEAVTRLSINPNQTILASASEDLTVFIHLLQQSSPFISIVPIGYVTMLSVPTAISWRPNRGTTIVIGCQHGHVAEIDVPDKPRSYTELSYSLDHILRKELQFVSMKSEIRQQNHIDAINKRKEDKKKWKLAELKRMQAEDPSIEKDLAIYLEDSESEEELEPLFYPKIPNKVLWLQYTTDQTIWLSMAGYDAGYIYECVCDNDKSGVVRATIVADGDDIEINSNYEFEDYAIFGLQDGSIRVITKKENFRDLSDYLELTMHDNYNGKILGIAASYDFQYIFSIGSDGNLFSYKWQGPAPLAPTITTVKYMLPKRVTDIEDKNTLSLEEQKLKCVSDQSTKQANERKAKVLDILSEYKVRFKELMKKNRALPFAQQYTHDDLELDPRITNDFIDVLHEQLQLVRRKMAFDVEKATLAREKIMIHFTDSLDSLPIEISAIRTDKVVNSFRILKLDEEFFSLKDHIIKMIQEQKDKKWDIPIFDNQLGIDMQPTIQATESFLQGLTTSSMDLRLDPKMKRILEKYRERKSQERARDVERNIAEAQKPDPNQNHLDDIRAIEEAKKTIGDYKLKTDPNYEPNESQNTLQKYKEIIAIRAESFRIQNEYNQKVFQLRTAKAELYKFMEEKLTELNVLHEQMPENKRKFIQKLPEINFDKEYPEDKLKLTTQTGTGVEVKDLFTRRSETFRSSLMRAEKKKEDLYYRLEWQILGLGSTLELPNFDDTCAIIEKYPKLTDQKISTIQDIINLSETPPWQKELVFTKILHILAEQGQIIEDVEYRINRFDQTLEELSESRLQIETDAKFLEAFLVSLNQELYILRDFERLENDLVEQVESSLQDRNEMQTNIIRVKNSIEEHRKTIEKMLEQEKTIQNQFLSNIKSNKFADFLKRIFKKKFKPPKEVVADESEESSASSDTSSSEEEEDAKSIYSLDVAPIRLDENYCPPGCDRDLYELTFQLRAERHLLEQRVYEEYKAIDMSRKQIEEISSKMNAVDIKLTAHRETLMEFRREKQSYLNKVKTVVVLKMDQMQYFKKDENICDVGNTLLFSMPSVTKLYTRVGQLYVETEEAKQKHRINIVHLSRMKADCKYMEHRITRLKSEIDEAMIRKFGRIVNLDDLEESVLRRFVFNLRVNISDEKKDADKKIAESKLYLASLEQELIKETQLGTEKLNILTVLQEEKNYQNAILQRQNKILEKMTTGGAEHIDFRYDLNKLKVIERQQQEQIEYLEKEIRSLRLKAKTFLSPDDQKTEPAGFNEVLPRDEHGYEEYVYMAVNESTKDETTGKNANVNVFEKVNVLIGKFLIKTLSHEVDENFIRKYTTKIAKHLAYVANNLDRTQSSNATECIVKFIHSTIPQKYHASLKDFNLRKLFHDVIGIVQDTHSVINSTDILAAIISNAQEVAVHIHELNITQTLITEIFKEMIEVLPVVQICNSATVDQIASVLVTLPAIDSRCINFTMLADDAIHHAKENMNDDITLNVVRHFTDMLTESLNSKFDAIKAETMF